MVEDKNAIGTVYHIFNKITGKCYVGQTWDTLPSRWRGHQRKDSPCLALKRAINKHGKNNFSISTLTIVHTQKDLDDAETYWTKYFNCLAPAGYNLKEGGARGKFSQETLLKMSVSRRLRPPISEETKKKISLTLTGRKIIGRRKPPPFSKDAKLKMSLSKLGKKKSDETKQRMKDAWKLRKLCIENGSYKPLGEP